MAKAGLVLPRKKAACRSTYNPRKVRESDERHVWPVAHADVGPRD
jgi:hypothetical protein